MFSSPVHIRYSLNLSCKYIIKFLAPSPFHMCLSSDANQLQDLNLPRMCVFPGTIQRFSTADARPIHFQIKEKLLFSLRTVHISKREIYLLRSDLESKMSGFYLYSLFFFSLQYLNYSFFSRCSPHGKLPKFILSEFTGKLQMRKPPKREINVNLIPIKALR